MDPGNINKDVGGTFLKLGSVKSAAKGGEREILGTPFPLLYCNRYWLNISNTYSWFLFVYFSLNFSFSPHVIMFALRKYHYFNDNIH